MRLMLPPPERIVTNGRNFERYMIIIECIQLINKDIFLN